MDHADVFYDLKQAGDALVSPVVTIGNFDGVHIGHQEIFSRARRRANQQGVGALALTFSPHPVRFFRPDTEEFRLTTDPQKFRLILQTGIDAVFALQFDRRVADLEPVGFVDQLLDQGLGASRVIVGANFAFGKNRAGSTDDLARLCSERGIATDICQKVEFDGEVVSSTRIRESLKAGRVRQATDLLGRRHRLAGTVVEGDKRGRELGYPTANIVADNLVPADGIYATYLHVDNQRRFPAATSIGQRPTFEVGDRATEAYVLDRDDLELYGASVELEFVEFLRPEKAFEDADALVEQIDEDVRQTRAILGLD